MKLVFDGLIDSILELHHSSRDVKSALEGEIRESKNQNDEKI